MPFLDEPAPGDPNAPLPAPRGGVPSPSTPGAAAPFAWQPPPPPVDPNDIGALMDAVSPARRAALAVPPAPPPGPFKVGPNGEGYIPPGGFQNVMIPPESDPFAQTFRPSAWDTITAAFEQQNSIISVLRAIHSMPGNESQPGYNPLDTLRGTSHEGDNLSIYAGSQNEGYTRALMAQKDGEDQERRTLAASGAFGTVAQIAAGMLDPTLAIPFVGEIRAVTVLGRAAEIAARAAAGSALSETALHGSQVSRSWQESGQNVASSAILGGILGGALAHLSPAEGDYIVDKHAIPAKLGAWRTSSIMATIFRCSEIALRTKA
jgi:hypothetical protein